MPKLTPEIERILREHQVKLFRQYGLICAHRSDGYALESGTVTFVSLNGVKYLLTAAHVSDALLRHDYAAIHLLNKEYGSGPSYSEGIKFDPIVVAESKLHDISFILAPENIKELESVSWFDLKDQINAVEVIRNTWSRDRNSDAIRPYYVMGFPNFAKTESDDLRVKISTASPILVGIVHWDESVKTIYPESQKPSQITLEENIDKEAPLPSNVSEIERLTMERHSLIDENDSAAVGGYSGGPVVVCAADGSFLIGTVKEGIIIYGEKRFIATPLDVALQLISGCL